MDHARSVRPPQPGAPMRLTPVCPDCFRSPGARHVEPGEFFEACIVSAGSCRS